MGNILELLFGNFLIIIAIVGGIISWINRSRSSDKGKDSREFQPNPTPVSSGDVEKGQEGNGTKKDNQFPSSLEGGANSYYDQKEAMVKEANSKLEESASLQTNEISNDGTTQNNIKVHKKREKNNKAGLSVNDYLTRKGIAESVIMAEVLGSPRAKKPYRSVIDRKRN